MASYDTVNYGLRPSKAVERKLFIECLQLLSRCGYYMPDYKYVGMGSPHYIDFNIFHRHLYIDEMLCAERSNAEDRMRFNLPFGFVELEMKPIGNLISMLDRERRHLVWLDYDSALGESILQDLSGYVQVLAAGSVFIISVAADIKTLRNYLVPPELRRCISVDDQDIYVVDELNKTLGHYLPKPFTLPATPKSVATNVSGAIRTCIEEHAKQHRKLEFIQLFNCRYTDGTTQMLTIGGLLDTASARQELNDANIYDHYFMRDEADPVEITVPPLTLRERNWIDTNVIGKKEPEKLVFELDKKLLQNYIRFYRHYPNYHETVL